MGGYGPAPKPSAERARVNKPPVADLVLPPGGYQGAIPLWPLARKSAGDLHLWTTLWRTPQAAAWARMGDGMARTVARYVLMWRSNSDKAPAELRQMEDRLGLNPLAMRRLGWETAADDIPDEVAQPVDTASRYEGLRAVPE